MMETFLPSLQEHQQLCRELLAAYEQEAACLQSGDLTGLDAVDTLRRQLLPRLSEVAQQLRAQRQAWEQLPEAQRQMPPALRRVIEENQDLVLRLLTLDRENQQGRLRLGLVPPTHWPAPAPSGAGYVSELYRRHVVA